MTTIRKTLDFGLQTVQSPWTSIPAGYTKVTGSDNFQIANRTTNVWEMVTGGVTAILRDNTVLSGRYRTSETKIAPLTTMPTLAGACVLDSGDDGYAVVTSSAANNYRIFEVINGQMLTTVLWTGVGATYSASAVVRFIYDDTDKKYRVYVNGTQIFASGSVEYTSSKYTPTYAASLSRGGSLSELSSEYETAQTVDTITDPIVLGSAISIGLTGYTAPTSVTGGGMSATGLSYSSGTLTATWPALSETLAPTVALPATDLTITVTESGGSATITADVNLPVGYVATTFMSVIDDPRYIGGNITLSDGWLAYYDNDQPEVGNIEIQADGRIIADNAGTFIMFLHKFGGDNSITQYNITINEAGDVVNIGLTSPGLVSRGLVSRGLVRTGL